MSDAPGRLDVSIPCGPAYKANLLAAIAWLRPNSSGPAQTVLDRLVASVDEAEYREAES